MFKSEKIAYTLLKAYYKDVRIYVNHRPNWLKNPLTGHNLELDFYIPSHNVAYEINGYHHFNDPVQKIRDGIKQRLCKERGIILHNIRAHQKDLHALRAQFRLVGVIDDQAIKYTFKKRKRNKKPTKKQKLYRAIMAQKAETESIKRRKGEACE